MLKTTDADQVVTSLSIFVTSDLHVHLLPYDYFNDRPAPTIGLAQTAGVLAVRRDQAVNSILLDNGDFLQGSPLSDILLNRKPDTEHPVIGAMNLLEYDAVTLGNHEFNYGLDYLQSALKDAAFPIVSSNILLSGAASDPGKTLVPPYIILERDLATSDGGSAPIRIGIIGFAPPQTADWDKRVLHGQIETQDILDAARTHIPRLRADGADIVIALCHSGIGAEHHSPNMENAAVPLAAVDGIDVVIAGHTHMVFPGPQIPATDAIDPVAGTIHGKPAVMPGFFGSHLGVIDLSLTRSGGQWIVTSHTSRAEPVSLPDPVETTNAADPRLLDYVQDIHTDALVHLRRPLGQLTTNLNNYFAMAAPDASLTLLCDAQRQFVARELSGSKWQHLPLLSSASPFKAGGRAGPENYIDVPPGDLTLRNAAQIYPYPNTVCVVKISGATLREWLERSASQFNQVAIGSTNEFLLHPNYPSYNFDVIDGITYEIDLSAPARYDNDGKIQTPDSHRIQSLSYQGQPLSDRDSVLVITNSYRAAGGGGYRMVAAGEIVFDAPISGRDILINHIKNNGPHDPVARPIWRFSPLPETSTTFWTGQNARSHPIPDHLEDTQTTQDGFAVFRLHFR